MGKRVTGEQEVAALLRLLNCISSIYQPTESEWATPDHMTYEDLRITGVFHNVCYPFQKVVNGHNQVMELLEVFCSTDDYICKYCDSRAHTDRRTPVDDTGP